MKNLLKKAMILLLMVGIVSCTDDDDNSNFNPIEISIAEVLLNSPDYSSLLAAVNKAELTETLSGSGSFTVFAPNNAAFDEFFNGQTLDDFTKEEITQLLLNHVLGTEKTAANLQTGYESNLAIGPIEGQTLSMFIDTSNGVKINGIATVTLPDATASNGVIHGIDKVIPLPTMLTFVTADAELSSLATTATNNSNFTTDFAAVLSAMDSDITLLAPDNEAFGAIDLSGSSDAAIEQTLLNHVIGGVNTSALLSTSYASTLATYNGTDTNLNIYINTDNGVKFNGISEVTTADILAINGVIHKVGAVITLPTVVTFAAADPNFSTLVSALTTLTPSVDFVATLNTPLGTDPSPFTVFAPVNAAFEALDAIPDEAGLIPVLQYHVVAGANVRSTDLSDGQVVTTLETGTFTINTSNGVTITDENSRVTNVVFPDVQAANGVIHVVDQVLLPSN